MPTNSINNSLYKILQISKTATTEEIDMAYHQLAREYYVLSIDSINNLKIERKFKIINRAYMVLSDVNRRKIYDDFGPIGLYIADIFGEDKMLKYVNQSATIIGVTIMATVTCCFCCFCCFCKECCLRHAEWDDDELLYS